MSVQKGACHCGKVTFEFSNPVRGAMQCNCSICQKKGAIWHATDNAHFKILSGENDLSRYQFGTQTAKHFFCKHCGVSTFSNPRLAPDAWVVNLRCVDGIELDALQIQMFDGKNWEQAAQEFLQARTAPPA